MKKLFLIISFGLAILLVACSTVQTSVHAQASEEALIEKLAKPDFTFHPRTVSPIGGGAASVDYTYSLKLSADTVSAYLPYYGEAYRDAYGSDDMGINFVSTDFECESVENPKDGSRKFVIVPKDLKDTNLSGLIITIDASKTGYATVGITQDYRQSISFHGVIE
ncbi:hypothetical protein M2132_000332 [Dysgonomonas sp. PH5-45]|uniref:DUF4251 domain-containing protein n=1 Tax=unclassified Dysgonomonas TaxID=2630389 RepID=UPI0024734600|nr:MULTISPECIES: DUF4251 domain-containing protein [unclassified Dysgonomonas]MDH6354012.1 hypothetical protein [Dysgonomonas sp. PH5-45]MDH6386914.1 hypothetical protein [Dysgonomonas sp. PH5-37]